MIDGSVIPALLYIPGRVGDDASVFGPDIIHMDSFPPGGLCPRALQLNFLFRIVKQLVSGAGVARSKNAAEDYTEFDK